MTKEQFIIAVTRIRNFCRKMDSASNILQINWENSIIGEMIDIFYDVLIPDASDEIIEDFGDLLWAKEIETADISAVYDDYIESL